MDVTEKQVTMITIKGAERLDPIRVIFDDTAPRAGRVTIECYGTAWACWWGATGDSTIKWFFRSCDTDYLVGKFMTSNNRSEGDREYLARIIEAIKTVLKAQGEGKVPT